ncbi:splicing factor-like protein [Rhynchospora pubera]|uniref:Splicing factor-like protein n=1 Tax=Rhynchospora pubera TaxID=906938 RepID=A0AAV8G2U3_9POAL|nr:splicing factor-like protein [Rhynchospora pubera]
MAIYQIFVKHLDGNTLCLQLPSPTISGETFKLNLSRKCHLPLQFLRLTSGTREVSDQTLISADGDHLFPSLSLLPRLRGGKGGFGSLLRGAASKAGQKKTSNFDACRDMSGRRLRHVNAEKRLEEWKAEAEERKLEKLAEDFLKKKAKEGKKSSDLEVEKYLEKYRKDAERCIGEVEESVKESFGLYKECKRKVLPASGPGSSKRLKIWMGKKKIADSDSESDSDEEEEKNMEDTKSVIIDEGNSSSSSDKAEEEGSSNNSSSSPVSGSTSNGELSGRESLETISEEENNTGDTVESDVSVEAQMESNTGTKTISEEHDVSVTVKSDVCVEAESNVETKSLANVEVANDEVNTEVAAAGANSEVTTSNICFLGEPLNFENYNSPTELEVLGMERLKSELQKNGLKCGGTLQERAARLFLLKTTPLDKLPKKILAKPLALGK